MTGNELKNLDSGVKIELDGKEYEITMDFNAICDLEDRYGSFEKVEKVLNGIDAMDFTKSSTMKDLRFLLYVMLRHSDESITEREAGRLLTIQSAQKIMNALGKAMHNAAGDDEKNLTGPRE